MQYGPNIIRACPNCSEPFIQPTIFSSNTFGAKFWSDYHVDAPMSEEISRFVVCPKCKTSFWLEDAIKIEMLEQSDTNVKYPAAEYYTSPLPRHYIEALSELVLSKDDELYLRIKLFHDFNDRFRYDLDDPLRYDFPGLFVPVLPEQEKENKLKLLEILDDSESNLLLKAEILRELGDFEQALTMLSASFPPSHRFAAMLTEHCLQKNTDVFQIRPTIK